jgi:hypothetical protein
VPIHHVALALVVAILGQYVFVDRFTGRALAALVLVELEEVRACLSCLLSVAVAADFPLFQDVVDTFHKAFIEDFLLLLALLVDAVLLLFDLQLFFVEAFILLL